MTGDGPAHFIYERPLPAGAVGQVEQIDLPALGQIQRPQIVAEHIDLHVGIGDPVAYLLRDLLAQGQDLFVIIGLNRQNIHARKAIAQVHRIRSKSQNIPVNAAPEQEAQRLLCVVECGKGHDINSANVELALVLHSLRSIQRGPLQPQRQGRTLAHIDRSAPGNQLCHTAAVVLVFMAYETGIKFRHPKTGKLLELFMGDPALNKNAGIPVADDVGIAMGRAG